MKALVYDGPHQLRLTDLPEPVPSAGEVKLRVKACGICGSDVHGYTGESGRRTPGQVMGHEFAGEIRELGAGVSDWHVGDRVAVYNIVPGSDAHLFAPEMIQCSPGKKVLGVNTGKVGAFAEYICVPSANLARLNSDVSYATALLNEPLAVSYHALRHVPADAKTLVIVGGGTIGQCLARVARVMQNWDVYLLEPLSDKRELAASTGAKVLPSDLNELAKYLPHGADASIEAVGVESTLITSLRAIKPGGTLVVLGNLAKQVTLPYQEISSYEKKLVGSYGFSPSDFRTIIGWINDGRFDLSPLLSGSCDLAQTPTVFEELATGKRQAVKIVVEP
ncbi:alcohol dehydrogenase catalytic domain-containing protein [bacterium]|nr:alcohol dehydrogenase catalytic domain-containing protein [bacterium]